MNRRKFIALASTSTVSLLAGCSFGDNKSTKTPSQTPTDKNETTTQPTVEGDIPLPKNMTEIAKFAYNHHKEQLRSVPFKLHVEATNKTPERNSSQTINFKYNGEHKSFFALEYTAPESSGTVEQYSNGGRLYIRRNPENGEITYDREQVDDENGNVFMLTGVNQIDQLDVSGVKVSQPKNIKEKLYKYEITDHNHYDTVSGQIVLDLTTGTLRRVEFHGETADSSYDLLMEFTFGLVTVKSPAWIGAIGTTTGTN